MHLPHELVVLVTQSLGRRDLKSVRLVSKLWCSCASESLFTRIYVSANKVDLDAFNAITSDPVLSTCVRRLIYDGSEFMLDYSKTEYLNQLWSQTVSINEDRLSKYHDQEICDWVNATFESYHLDLMTIERLGHSKFITQGYEKYHEHAVYQHHSLRSGSFVDSLAQGLRKLSLLSSIKVESEWAVSSDGYLLGSPLSRNWDTFHASPTGWAWEEASVTLECPKPNGIGHYFIIVSALVRAQRSIRNLTIPDIPPEIFNRSDHSKPSVLNLDTVAFAGLEVLVLSLASWCAGHSDQATLEVCPNIHGLKAMLSSMTRLQVLDLALPYKSFFPSDYKCDQVFPKDTIWTQLETFKLLSLSTKATDFVDLLTFQMPKLQHLSLNTLELSDGNWEGVVECLKQYSKLSKLRLLRLYCNDGKEFNCFAYPLYDLEDEFQYLLELIRDWGKEISEYIIHGGRHPCLRPGQPDSAAEDFAKDLKPFLRCCGSSQSTRITDAS